MQNKNAIKIAYIIFLIICAVYHIIADIFHLEFEAWERLVCAATIASYFFSGASSNKTILSITEKLKKSLEDSNKELIMIKKEREQFPEKYIDSKYKEEYLDDAIEKNEKTLQKLNKKNNWTFRLNVIGFLAFFCIFAFTGVYRFFANSQEFFTLLAFILILVAETYEEFFMNNYYWILENSHELNKTEINQKE